MSEENAPTPDAASEPAAKPETRVRRISNPRPTKKSARPSKAIRISLKAPAAEKLPEIENAGPAAEAPPESTPPSFPVFESEAEATKPEPVVEHEQTFPLGEESDWPEPEPASSGEAAPQEGGKRNKRRRKRGKGGANAQGASGSPDPVSAENPGEGPAAASGSQNPHGQSAPRPHSSGQGGAQQPSRPKHEPEELSKRAWKIYLSEVSEEGVALIGDNDARELAKRCFRLAEIFLDEHARRSRPGN